MIPQTNKQTTREALYKFVCLIGIPKKKKKKVCMGFFVLQKPQIAVEPPSIHPSTHPYQKNARIEL